MNRLLNVIELLDDLKLDYLLVCSTNEFLVEYSALSENARYTLTGFSGSTGDALVSKDGIYLFVDGRYHVQADNEVHEGIKVIKLNQKQKQDDEIAKLIKTKSTFGIVTQKISQKRLESFQKLLNKKNIIFKYLINDPINNHTEKHSTDFQKVSYKPKTFKANCPTYISNLEEVSYLSGYRDFSINYSSKIWAKLFFDKNSEPVLFKTPKESADFLKNYENELAIDKNLINAYEYSLIKKPIEKKSAVQKLKSIKTTKEIESYKKAFEATDRALNAIRNYIDNNENLSEFDISEQLKKEFIKYGAKTLSFKSIVAINENSALAHYSKNSKDIILKKGDLVLIDCGAYYEDGLATDITRVFVKDKPNNLQKKIYTLVLKAFLNCFNSKPNTGYELNNLAHSILDDKVEGFNFSHGLGHGIGINVHEAPPSLSYNDIAKKNLKNNMTFTIEPGLYNPKYFGIRLENSCFIKDNKICSFTKMGFESKLIDKKLLNTQELSWLKDFELL